MKRFDFSAANVMRHKEWLEREAQRILGQEIITLHECQENLKELEQEREDCIKDRQAEKDLAPNIHLVYLEFDRKLSAAISGQQEKIKAQEGVVSEKTLLLEAAVKEKKKIEKLKEREYEDYKLKSKRKETSKMDEISANFNDRNSQIH